jgi:hypothetical protein
MAATHLHPPLAHQLLLTTKTERKMVEGGRARETGSIQPVVKKQKKKLENLFSFSPFPLAIQSK